MTSTLTMKVGDEVVVGITNRVKLVILEIVNEFQVKVTNKREYEKGNIDGGWLVDINSITHHVCRK